MALTLQFQYYGIDKTNIFTKREVQSLGNGPVLSSQKFWGTFTQHINVYSVHFLSPCRLELSHAVLFFHCLHFFRRLSETAASYLNMNDFLANLHLFAALGFQYVFTFAFNPCRFESSEYHLGCNVSTQKLLK